MINTRVCRENPAEILAQILQDDDMSDVVIIFRDDSWGNALNDALVESLKETGITVRGDISYSTDIIDYGDIMTRTAQSLNPEGTTGIVLLAFNEIIHIVDSAASADNFGNTKWYSVDFVRDRLLEDSQREEFLIDVDYTAIAAHVPPNDINGEINTNVCNSETDNACNTGIYSYAAYDAVFILGMAIDMVGSSTDTAALATAIPAIAGEYTGAMGNTTLDSNGDLAYSSYSIRTLQADADDITITCGPAKVTGKVFADTNGNGFEDPGERGIGKLAVFADGHHSMTNEKGTYTVSCLSEDTHTIKINTLPAGYNLPDDSPSPMQIPVSAGHPGIVDFALVPMQTTPVTLNVLAFNDNGDGIRDAGENGVPGITILTYTPSTSKVGIMITGADGTATKSDIAPDTFYAITLLPENRIVTGPTYTTSDGTKHMGVLLVENPTAGSTYQMNVGIVVDRGDVVAGAVRDTSTYQMNVGITVDPCTILPQGTLAEGLLDCR